MTRRSSEQRHPKSGTRKRATSIDFDKSQFMTSMTKPFHSCNWVKSNRLQMSCFEKGAVHQVFLQITPQNMHAPIQSSWAAAKFLFFPLGVSLDFCCSFGFHAGIFRMCSRVSKRSKPPTCSYDRSVGHAERRFPPAFSMTT